MKKLILILTFVAGMGQAQAGIVVEPFVGYTLSGDFDAEAALGGKGSIAGLSLGARVGYSLLGFTFGAEYILNTKREVTNDVAGGSNFDYDTTGIGVYAAYDLPVLLRGFVGYTFSYNGNLLGTAAGSSLVELSKGNGFFIGAGYTGLPFISVNLEFRSYSFDEGTQSGTTVTLSKADATQLMLSVSAPLSLPFL